MFVNIQTVGLDERILGGMYNFRVIDALTYEPISGLTGTYTAGQNQSGDWLSLDTGDVYLENLKTGLTNVQITNNPDYFNHVINGAKVLRPSHSTLVPGRTIMAVPRDINNVLVLTMTWLGKENELNLIAESNQKTKEGCLLGYFNPKCYGMLHRGVTDELNKGETITIHPKAFFNDDGKLIKNKKILVYVGNGSTSRQADITASNAQIGITVLVNGQVHSLNVPFMT